MHAIRRLLDSKYEPQPKEDICKITFTSDKHQTLEGDLIPGDEVRIVYDPARIPGFQELPDKQKVTVFVEVSYNVSNETGIYSTKLDGPNGNTTMMSTVLKIPSKATTFVIWFKQGDEERGYDYGDQYKFPFNQIVFTGTWDAYVEGCLNPGGKFRVVYDSTRLPWRDKACIGFAKAWHIFAHAQFSENGPAVEQMLKGPEPNNATMTTVFDTPCDAEKVIMWFHFAGQTSGTHYDSNNSANYHFALNQ